MVKVSSHQVILLPQRVHGKRKRNPLPRWAIFTYLILGLAVILSVGWDEIRPHFEARRLQTTVQAATGGLTSPTAAWRDSLKSTFEDVAREVRAGGIDRAEGLAERASELIATARQNAAVASPEVFDQVAADLDSTIQSLPLKPEYTHVSEHLNQAWVLLAEYRSAQEPGLKLPSDRAVARTPRSVAAEEIVSPKNFGARVVDATALPDAAEILLPPANRIFTSNVRVEDLTFNGAAQTLDGIHWKNVAFVGMRIRYQGGEVELTKVRFVNCQFGFVANDRSARLARAITLGNSSLVIE